MWILWKMSLWKCEFCEKCYFQNVNFVKIETLNMWILLKMWFSECEFCKNWNFQNVNFWMNWWILPQCGFVLILYPLAQRGRTHSPSSVQVSSMYHWQSLVLLQYAPKGFNSYLLAQRPYSGRPEATHLSSTLHWSSSVQCGTACKSNRHCPFLYLVIPISFQHFWFGPHWKSDVQFSGGRGMAGFSWHT